MCHFLYYSLTFCAFVVLFRLVDDFCYQRNVAELETEVHISVGTVEVSPAEISVLGLLVQTFHFVNIADDGVGIFNAVISAKGAYYLPYTV